MPRPIPVLSVYVITSAVPERGRGHAEVAAAAIAGGANVVQLRAPEYDVGRLLPLARELAEDCRRRGVLFVVNNSIDLALQSGAGGVHLGQGDGVRGDGLARARERLGPRVVLGVSVEEPAQAVAAELAGADYAATCVWATTTKPEAEPHGLAGVRAVAAATRLPVVGIGGITAENAPEVLAAGAKGIAVVSAVGGATDPVAATRALVAAVRGTSAPPPRASPAILEQEQMS